MNRAMLMKPDRLTRESRSLPTTLIDHRHSIFAVVALYVACLLVLGPTVRFSQWTMGPDTNHATAEAMSWINGRLDLAPGGMDVALYQGRYFNVFPPLWTLVCWIVFKAHLLILGEPIAFFPMLYVLLVAVPIPIVYYLAFRRSGTHPNGSALLAFYAIAGTCLWPFATGCQKGFTYSIQLVVAQIGLGLLLLDLLGKRRLWLAGCGLLIAAWSRQTCLAFALPLVYVAWRSPNRRSAFLRAGIPLLVTVAVPMLLNHAKFGSPFETGYRYIFEESDSTIRDKYADPHGSPQIFGWRYVPHHAYHMWVAPPSFDFSLQEGLKISGDADGTAVWVGTPLLAWALFDVRRWWRDPVRRMLMLATLPIILALLFYHGPGLGQPGYYRYSLDFGIVWLVILAPGTTGPKRRGLTLICLVWSVFYFYMITRPGL